MWENAAPGARRAPNAGQVLGRRAQHLTGVGSASGLGASDHPIKLLHRGNRVTHILTTPLPWQPMARCHKPRCMCARRGNPATRTSNHGDLYPQQRSEYCRSCTNALHDLMTTCYECHATAKTSRRRRKRTTQRHCTAHIDKWSFRPLLCTLQVKLGQ